MATTATKKKSTDEAKAPSFEQALARLEAIVEQLDDGNLPLDQALALFKEGTGLAKQCRSMLADAEVQVKEALRDIASAGGDEDDDDDLDDEDDLDEDEDDVDEGDLDEEDEDEDKL